MPVPILARLALASAGAILLASSWARPVEPQGQSRTVANPPGCLHCHAGIEPLHSEAGLSCTDCHGGDGA